MLAVLLKIEVDLVCTLDLACEWPTLLRSVCVCVGGGLRQGSLLVYPLASEVFRCLSGVLTDPAISTVCHVCKCAPLLARLLPESNGAAWPIAPDGAIAWAYRIG